jgi:hypothetical protein
MEHHREAVGKEGISKQKVVHQFSSCIVKDECNRAATLSEVREVGNYGWRIIDQEMGSTGPSAFTCRPETQVGLVTPQ